MISSTIGTGASLRESVRITDCCCRLYVLNTHLADYLAKKLTEAREGQLRTTDHFAGLTAVARAAKATRWARMNIHTEAPTPSNFEQAEATFLESVYVLNAAQSACLATP